MGLFVCVIILVINQMVCSAPTKFSEQFPDVLTKNCPELLQNNIVKECLNASVVKLSNVSNKNEENVLCTIYLYHFSEFSNKLSFHNCSETLFFPKFKENDSNITCSEPNFMLLNETISEELKGLKIKCLKLCFNWKTEVNEKCRLAHYYNNFKFDSQNENKLKKSKPINLSLEMHETNVQKGEILPAVQGSHNEQKTIDTKQNGSSYHVEEKNVNSANVGADKNDTHQNVATQLKMVDNGIGEKNVHADNIGPVKDDDTHQNVATYLNLVDNGIKEKNVHSDNVGAAKNKETHQNVEIIKHSKQHSAQLTTEKNELSVNEDEKQSVFGDASAGKFLNVIVVLCR